MEFINGRLEFDSEQEKTTCMNAYNALHINPYGKEWLDSLRIDLMDHKGEVRSTFNELQLAYSAGNDDFVRKMLSQVDAYKFWLDQEGINT